MDIIYIIIIFFLGFFIPSRLKNKLSKSDIKTLNILWVYHFCVSIAYYFYIRNRGGDSWRYWIEPQQMTSTDFISNLFGAQDVRFMIALNYIPANLLGMGFFANTLLYGLFGFIAFIFLYRIRNRFVATFKAAPFVIQGFFLFFIMGALVFSMIMSNLGIILRERNMFLPGLIFFILWSFSYKQELALKRKYA